MKNKFPLIFFALAAQQLAAQSFELNQQGYFNCAGVDVMASDDFYPEGHQGGVSLLMNGRRIASNGDIRLEATPGQWQPVPRKLDRQQTARSITTTLCFPDSSRHMTGFNPMIYPELQLRYNVSVEAEGQDVVVTVDLDSPIPEYLVGKAGFNMEFFPGILFGQPWMMDEQTGIYPQQPNSPVITLETNLKHTGNYHLEGKPEADFKNLVGKGDTPYDYRIYSPIVADDVIAEPYAVGRTFTSCPNDPLSRVTIKSLGQSELKLYDGRMNHNNGWFVLRSEIPAGATKGAVKWRISPSIEQDWMYKPVVQTSQVGYATAQPKQVVIELDKRDTRTQAAGLYRLTPQGEQFVRELRVEEWGNFLRYRYLNADFSDVREDGLYCVRYGESESAIFRIAQDVYDRGVWQPVVEYSLPVQMCHMRVNEKYRVWHDACHMDDARMAPAHNHVDGYDQQPGLSPFAPGDQVPGVNVGGWHDAGDFDLRVESQAGESYILSLAFEAFHPEIDATAIDQKKHVCEIHQPDGRNDMLQQIENGALTVVAGYRALGRLYRGIICNSLRQYAMLGDAAAMTNGYKGDADDRWIFTEDNPGRELSTAANLAATARALRGFNDDLAGECLEIAQTLFAVTDASSPMVTGSKLQAAAELYLATEQREYLDYILSLTDMLQTPRASRSLWFLARVEQKVSDLKRDKQVQKWVKAYRAALQSYAGELAQTVAETPYGVPYRPAIWGAGWDIQNFGFQHYYLVSAYPEIFSADPVYNALNFILSCHPGTNQASFASGVGAQSATVGYGLNRADWSYIPGGVVSGTALIRPDFPELLTFPFLWQQVEYVLGGGSSHYMFLVLAAQQLSRG